MTNFTLRTQGAGLTALAGCAVAIMMQIAGGDLGRFLPQPPMMQISALIGAGLAGAICVDGFGRGRWHGHLLACVTCVLSTVLGAICGAVFALGVQGIATAHTPFGEAIEAAPSLGLLAVSDALVNSIPVAITWGLSMAAVHLKMHQSRHATT